MTFPARTILLSLWIPAVAIAQDADADFAARCAAPGVVRWVGFDSPADFNTGSGGTNGAWGQNSGILPPWGTTDYTRATRDTAVKASGDGSLRFTIPANSPADTSGSFFTNFSSDLSTQFGAGDEFYVQWRQRFSSEFITTRYAGGGGFKQIDLSTGDQPGRAFGTCEAIEVVMNNYYQQGFPVMYDSCTGSASHGPYDPFFEPFGTYDFKLQNARPSPFSLYSQKNTSYFPPVGNTFGYFADEWMTFQVCLTIGPRVGDEFVGSRVRMWMSREGQPSEPVIDFGPYNLTAGDPAEDQRFGKIWLLPYNTGKSAAQTYPTAYTWYDELIISRNRIADPAGAAAGTTGGGTTGTTTGGAGGTTGSGTGVGGSGGDGGGQGTRCGVGAGAALAAFMLGWIAVVRRHRDGDRQRSA